ALQPVLGLAALKREERGPEPDEEPGDLHPERPGGAVVAVLVQGDGDQDPEREQDHADCVRHYPSPRCSMMVRARARAHASAAQTCSPVPGSPKSSAPQITSATVSTMPRKGNRRSRHAATHSSLAAL